MKNKENNFKVSICCITYNQEKYIAECLESLVSQKTNFDYEIIVHDDASTDNTPKIIKEYQEKYPHIIRPIYQTENQYSKNSQKVLEIIFNKTTGKYIAICEGDDYWIDELKLQKQYDYLEKNPKCTLLSADYQVLENGKITKRASAFNSECDVDIPMFLNRKTSIQTATLFFRKSDILPLPDYFYKAHVGDIPMELHLISKGYLHYIPEIISVYRYQAEGSFSSKNKNNISLKKENHIKTKKIYNDFNETTKLKYNENISEYLLKYDFDFYLSIDDLKELKKEKYKDLYKEIPFKKKIKLHLKNNKIIYSIYQKIKKYE